MGKLLLVEDEAPIRTLMRMALTTAGYAALEMSDGRALIETLEQGGIDLILLDVMLPGEDGFTLLDKIRRYQVPVIFVSARSQLADKVQALQAGADDYITKPFEMMELLARVNSQLRRYAKFLSLKEHQSEDEQVYTVGGLELNNDTKEVSLDGNPVRLTPIEFRILQLLMKNPGRVYSAEEIYERVWNEEAIATDTVMVHIRNIREKIEIDPRNPRYLKVVWGVGYKIEKG